MASMEDLFRDQHPEQVNLAAHLNEKELDRIGKEVIEDFESDEQSRAEWLEKHAKWLRLYYQTDEPVNRPWQGSSDESLPMLAEGCNQFHARAYPALFPNELAFKGKPSGKVTAEDRQRADRIGKHISWQLMVRDKSYVEKKDALLLAIPLHGSYFTNAYYHPLRKIRLCIDNVRPNDLVLPYGTGPRELEEIDRKTQIVWMSQNDTRIYEREGYFVRAGDIYEERERDEVDIAHDDAQGLTPPDEAERTGECKILQQQRLLDLDKDGIREPYTVWVDVQSEKVLRIAVRYEVDSDGMPADEERPVETYTHYQYLPNPDGIYALGLGHLVGQLNSAVNKLLRQQVDAGSLQNSMAFSGFINEATGLAGGEIELSFGQWKKVHGDGKMNELFFQPRVSEPSQTLFSVLELALARGDRLQMVTEALTGQTDKVLQPTALMALIEQGLQPFTAVYERVWRAIGRELDKVFRINRLYMPDEEYFTVNEFIGPMSIARDDYKDDLQVVPIADPKRATEQQKLAKSEAEYQFGMTNPLVLQSQQHIYNLSRRRAEAIGVDDVEAILPAPGEIEGIRIDDPNIENMSALNPALPIPPVYPDQDHLLHIQAHEGLLRSGWGGRITGDGATQLQAHIQQHVAYAYGLTETDALDEIVDEPGPNPPMAGAPGDQMVFGGDGAPQQPAMPQGQGLGGSQQMERPSQSGGGR